MSTHPEQELLSPFIDGELTEREQVTLEAHLASCADCRGVLGALRATLGDLALITDAVPAERDSWALRSAIAKERRLDRRGRRWYLISGSAAAALVGILAFALSAGGGADGARGGPAALREFASHAPTLNQSATNYTGSSAKQMLLDFSTVTVQNDQLGRSRTESAGTGGAASPAPVPAQAYLTAKDAATAGGPDDLGRCIETVTRSTSQPLDVRYLEAASFDGEPAFLLVFEAASAKRLELWVVRRSDCHTLYFAQTRA